MKLTTWARYIIIGLVALDAVVFLGYDLPPSVVPLMQLALYALLFMYIIILEQTIGQLAQTIETTRRLGAYGQMDYQPHYIYSQDTYYPVLKYGMRQPDIHVLYVDVLDEPTAHAVYAFLGMGHPNDQHALEGAVQSIVRTQRMDIPSITGIQTLIPGHYVVRLDEQTYVVCSQEDLDTGYEPKYPPVERNEIE